jgi:hypothetical protein
MKLGDVVFQDLPTFISIGFLRLLGLIKEVQGNKGPEHCGICTGFWCGIPLITEAFIFGVWTIPFPLFILRWPLGLEVKSWNGQSLVPGILSWVASKKGLPYNINYTDSDNAYYCSSLIAKAYKVASGNDLSSTKTVAEVELSDAPAKDKYYKILGIYPVPTDKIWLVSDLENAKEFV